MNGEIYKAVFERGPEGGTSIHVTAEVNGFGVFLLDFEVGVVLLKWFRADERDKAIEWGVQEAIARRDEYKKDLEEAQKQNT